MPYFNNDLYIDHSRNFCVNLFLQQDCTDLIFIDSDLEFDDDSILKLIEHDKDIVLGAYPYKKLEQEFPVRLRYDINMNCREEETGLVYCKNGPAGLMRVNRRVFDQLIPDTIKDKTGTYQFFRTGVVFENDNNWYGEDNYFCKTWTDYGGEIFIEPNINFKHYGIQAYEGNYHEYLLGRMVDKLVSDNTESGPNGWMTDSELSILKYLASKSKNVVEIGSWKGRSTKALLESCKGMVYAVDHWKGSATDITQDLVYLKPIYDDFIKNVGHYENLIVDPGYSVDIAKNYENNSIDMVFIDAGHTYEECKADIEAWLPKCRKIIAGHDYTENYTGVVKAVNEKFSDINVIDTIWWKEF